MAGAVPGVGEFLLRFLRGGDSITEATLNRFFGFHVAILPAIVTPLLLFHLMLIQKQGMSVPMSVEREHRESGKPLKSIKFFPGFLLRELMGWYIALAVLAALAALFPWELGERADPFAPAPTDIKPEWYFLFMFQTLKYIPAKVFGFDGEVLGILAFGVGALIVILIPFIDRAALRGQESKVIQRAGILVIIYILVMSVISYVSSHA
jgi:quinol-cytochrome oxidoreductase complex cytochrome b subunit